MIVIHRLPTISDWLVFFWLDSVTTSIWGLAVWLPCATSSVMSWSRARAFLTVNSTDLPQIFRSITFKTS